LFGIGIFLSHQWFLALMNNAEKACSGFVVGWFFELFVIAIDQAIDAIDGSINPIEEKLNPMRCRVGCCRKVLDS
jgi:hypothetical protein